MSMGLGLDSLIREALIEQFPVKHEFSTCTFFHSVRKTYFAYEK